MMDVNVDVHNARMHFEQLQNAKYNIVDITKHLFIQVREERKRKQEEGQSKIYQKPAASLRRAWCNPPAQLIAMSDSPLKKEENRIVSNS